MKKKNIFLILATILLIAGGVIFYSFKTAPVSKEQFFAQSVDGLKIDKYSDGFLTYDGKQLIFYGTDMEQKWLNEINERDGMLYVNGKYILVVSKESGNVYLFDGNNKISQITSEKKLRGASLNENGYFVLLTEDKGYKGQCSVYDRKGRKKTEYSMGKTYIVSSYLSKDNSHLSMCVIEEGEENFKEKIVFKNIKSGETIAEIETGEIPTYTNVYKDCLLIGLEESLTCYSLKGKEKWSYNYDGGRADFIKCSGGYVSLVIKKGGAVGHNEIVTLKLSGRLKGSYIQDMPVEAFDTSNGFSASKKGNEIILLDRRGRLLKSILCDTRAEDIKLYKNEDKVLVLSGSASMKSFGR